MPVLVFEIHKEGVAMRLLLTRMCLTALAAVGNVTSTSAPGSTSSLSSDSSTGTGSTSGAVQSATLPGGVAVCAVVILAGIMTLG
jgi:hypothetical protein